MLYKNYKRTVSLCPKSLFEKIQFVKGTPDIFKILQILSDLRGIHLPTNHQRRCQTYAFTMEKRELYQ